MTAVRPLGERRLAEVLLWTSELLSTPVERHFSPTKFTDFAARHWEIPTAAVVLYLIFCFGGKRVMDNFSAFDLRLPLAGWNAFLCLFSFLGMCRTVRKKISPAPPRPRISLTFTFLAPRFFSHLANFPPYSPSLSFPFARFFSSSSPIGALPPVHHSHQHL